MLGEHVAVIADWLTVTEAARALSISPNYARTLATRNKLVAIRTHLGWLVDPASVEAYQPKRKPRKAQAA